MSGLGGFSPGPAGKIPPAPNLWNATASRPRRWTEAGKVGESRAAILAGQAHIPAARRDGGESGKG